MAQKKSTTMVFKMPYINIGIENKEQLCLLGRKILNDLLIQEQDVVKKIFFSINQKLSSQTITKSLSQDLVEDIKISLQKLVIKIIVDGNYDEITLAVNALLEYIIEQMVNIPNSLNYTPIYGCVNRYEYNSEALFRYYKQTNQTWFVDFRSSKNYDQSLNLNKEIENIINKLLTINELIYRKEVANKSQHLPLPSLRSITELLDKLKRMLGVLPDELKKMLDVFVCDKTVQYDNNQLMISKLIPILEIIIENHDDLKQSMLENGVVHILEIPFFAKRVPEYKKFLEEKLPITTRELDTVFYPVSSYRTLADKSYYSEDCVKTERWLNNQDLQKVKLRAKNIQSLDVNELLLLRFDLRNLLQNCILIQYDISDNNLLLQQSREYELSRSAIVFEKQLQDDATRLFKMFNQKMEEYLLNFNRTKELLQQKGLMLFQQEQERYILQQDYDTSVPTLTLLFNTEKAKIEEQKLERQQKEQLIQILTNEPSKLYSDVQIINGESSQTIIFNFVDFYGKKSCLRLKECQCAEKFQRNQLSKNGDYRLLMESNIVQAVVDNVVNKSEQINLVCIGSDWFGLTIILAKLYNLEYTNFNIINIEKQCNYDVSRKNNRLDRNCEQFWKYLFNDNQHNLQVIIGVKTIYNYQHIMAGKIFIFAEDLGLGGAEYRYKDIVSQAAEQLSKTGTGEIFYTNVDGVVTRFVGTLSTSRQERNRLVV